MSVNKNQGVVWTPLMPDRRKRDRRQDLHDYQSASRVLNISDRRRGDDRRQSETITVTGRAMEIGHSAKDLKSSS